MVKHKVHTFIEEVKYLTRGGWKRDYKREKESKTKIFKRKTLVPLNKGEDLP